MKTKVVKFGGSSLADAKHFVQVAKNHKESDTTEQLYSHSLTGYERIPRGLRR